MQRLSRSAPRPAIIDPSPSRWAERIPLAVAAAVGAAIATYLALVQVGVVPEPWDPVFGPASALRVLRSSLSRALPIPDAAAGAAGYALEIVLALAGGPDRWRERPRLVVAYGIVVSLFAIASAGLVVLQAAVIRSGCTLCLASAGLSIGIAAAGQREGRAALGVLRTARRATLHA